MLTKTFNLKTLFTAVPLAVIALTGAGSVSAQQHTADEGFVQYFNQLQNVQQHIGPSSDHALSAVENGQVSRRNEGNKNEEISAETLVADSSLDKYLQDLRVQQQHLEETGLEFDPIPKAGRIDSNNTSLAEAPARSSLVEKGVLEDYLEDLQVLQQHLNPTFDKEPTDQMADRNPIEESDDKTEDSKAAVVGSKSGNLI